ncbi:MAG TPA: GxxExxY protein [Allosphingosinicella sp.]|jgi:iron complex transport system substrate-binding protein
MNHDIEWLAKTAIDCGFRVHDDIGPGLLESAYQAFLAALLLERGLRVEVQKPVPVSYRGVLVRDAFRADLLIEGGLVIEIKSVERLAPVHSKQLLTYLRLMNQPLGLLMNFGADLFRDGLRRIINNRSAYVAPLA